MQEIWKDIKGYEGLYQVSNLGRVKRLRFINKNTNIEKERIKSQKIRKDGYLEVALYKNGKGKSIQVHRIVAKTFIPNIENKAQVNHIDGNKKNNNVSNLEWVLGSENMIHSARQLRNNVRKINQYDLDGRYLATYSSITIAGEINGIRESSIANVLAGRRNKAYGYKWRYSEE